METIIATLKPFFDNPIEGFHIREIARITKVNHTTTRKYLNRLVKENLLKKNKGKPYEVYKANTESKKYLNLKLFFNLEKLRISNLIEKIEELYDYPVIVLFGSYAKSTDDLKSDIDIFVLSNINREFDWKPYEKILERKINIHLFSEKEFKSIKTRDNEFLNSICNGITLSGQLEILT